MSIPAAPPTPRKSWPPGGLRNAFWGGVVAVVISVLGTAIWVYTETQTQAQELETISGDIEHIHEDISKAIQSHATAPGHEAVRSSLVSLGSVQIEIRTRLDSILRRLDDIERQIDRHHR